jgi:hypothetical protein
MDPRNTNLSAIEALISRLLPFLRKSKIFVDLLLRKGLTVVRLLVHELTRDLSRALKRIQLIAQKIPTFISKLSQAVGAGWFALWFLCFNSRALLIWKWTWRQLIKFEYIRPSYLELFRKDDRKPLKGLLVPATLALSLLGGLIRWAVSSLVQSVYET